MIKLLNRKSRIFIFILLMSSVAAVSVFICKNIYSISAVDMTAKINRQSVTGNKLDDKFINGTADFSVNLLKNSILKDKNTLISPMSACFALGMTSNGAEGSTKSQFQNVLCNGADIDEINRYYYTISHKITNDKEVKSTSSIWYNKDWGDNIKKEFLQKNIDYYGGNVFKTDFSEKKLQKI